VCRTPFAQPTPPFVGFGWQSVCRMPLSPDLSFQKAGEIFGSDKIKDAGRIRSFKGFWQSGSLCSTPFKFVCKQAAIRFFNVVNFLFTGGAPEV
jgi:hypothetical protein